MKIEINVEVYNEETGIIVFSYEGLDYAMHLNELPAFYESIMVKQDE